MADTRRTWAALAALYADNTAGAISPQDLRDGFASIKPHVASDAPTASDDETLGFDVGHAWIDTSTSPRSVYECVDSTTGNAVWVKRYPQDAGGSSAAEDVTYDNTTSGLAAEDVQAAIDELASEKANISDLGTAAAANVEAFATAAQGALADTALQPGDELTALAATGITAGYVPKADGAGNIAWGAESGGGGGNAYYDLQLGFPGAPDAGAIDMVLVPRTVTIDDADPGEVHVGVNPTDGTATIDIQVNGVSVGGIDITTGGVVTWDLSADIELAAGDTLALVAPSPADSTLADVIVALKGIAS